MPSEEEGKKARKTKWNQFDKDKFKGLVQKGQLQWDGSTEHREEIRNNYWPSRNKETFRRNWNTTAAELRCTL